MLGDVKIISSVLQKIISFPLKQHRAPLYCTQYKCEGGKKPVLAVNNLEAKIKTRDWRRWRSEYKETGGTVGLATLA